MATTFGRYELLERISVGGMAEVFKASVSGAAGFEKIVAIKRILPSLSDPKFIQMFVQEARISSNLNHPNIGQVYDFGEIEGRYFIALEFVHGKDLRSIQDHLRGNKLQLPIGVAIRVVLDVCSALDYAHSKRDASGQLLRLIHRDVSPQNVLISHDGAVKLIDFGIAKALTEDPKTHTGLLKGKFAYMSPEMVEGKPIDSRSDLFSLGIVLYELVTGQRLFFDRSDMGTLLKVRKADVPLPSRINPSLPHALDGVIRKTLARSPDDRYQRAEELYEALDQLSKQLGLAFSAMELARWMNAQFGENMGAATPPREGTPAPATIPHGAMLTLEPEPALETKVATPTKTPAKRPGPATVEDDISTRVSPESAELAGQGKPATTGSAEQDASTRVRLVEEADLPAKAPSRSPSWVERIGKKPDGVERKPPDGAGRKPVPTSAQKEPTNVDGDAHADIPTPVLHRPPALTKSPAPLRPVSEKTPSPARPLPKEPRASDGKSPSPVRSLPSEGRAPDSKSPSPRPLPADRPADGKTPSPVRPLPGERRAAAGKPAARKPAPGKPAAARTDDKPGPARVRTMAGPGVALADGKASSGRPLPPAAQQTGPIRPRSMTGPVRLPDKEVVEVEALTKAESEGKASTWDDPTRDISPPAAQDWEKVTTNVRDPVKATRARASGDSDEIVIGEGMVVQPPGSGPAPKLAPGQAGPFDSVVTDPWKGKAKGVPDESWEDGPTAIRDDSAQNLLPKAEQWDEAPTSASLKGAEIAVEPADPPAVEVVVPPVADGPAELPPPPDLAPQLPVLDELEHPTAPRPPAAGATLPELDAAEPPTAVATPSGVAAAAISGAPNPGIWDDGPTVIEPEGSPALVAETSERRATFTADVAAKIDELVATHKSVSSGGSLVPEPQSSQDFISQLESIVDVPAPPQPRPRRVWVSVLVFATFLLLGVGAAAIYFHFSGRLPLFFSSRKADAPRGAQAAVDARQALPEAGLPDRGKASRDSRAVATPDAEAKSKKVRLKKADPIHVVDPGDVDVPHDKKDKKDKKEKKKKDKKEKKKKDKKEKKKKDKKEKKIGKRQPAGEGYLLASSKPWAKILVDGQPTGRNTPTPPIAPLTLKAGKHTVTLVTESGQRFDFTVTIKPGETTTLVKTLKK